MALARRIRFKQLTADADASQQDRERRDHQAWLDRRRCGHPTVTKRPCRRFKLVGEPGCLLHPH